MKSKNLGRHRKQFSWGNLATASIQNAQITTDEIKTIKSKLIYRHIAWLYTFREIELLVPTQLEHVSLEECNTWLTTNEKSYGIGQFNEYLTHEQTKKYFEEIKNWETAPNQATYILHLVQTVGNTRTKMKHLICFDKQKMQKIVSEFNDHQGKAERIKKFPLPRQYASLSFIFTCIFIFWQRVKKVLTAGCEIQNISRPLYRFGSYPLL